MGVLHACFTPSHYLQHTQNVNNAPLPLILPNPGYTPTPPWYEYDGLVFDIPAYTPSHYNSKHGQKNVIHNWLQWE